MAALLANGRAGDVWRRAGGAGGVACCLFAFWPVLTSLLVTSDDDEWKKGERGGEGGEVLWLLL